MNKKLKDFEIPVPSVIPANKQYLVQSVGAKLYNELQEITDFDVNWNTLISSAPLLFEDVDYARIVTHNHINSCITAQELEAYREGVLRECYSTLENLLMCNLEYYDRIISFCTMMFFGYIRVNSEDTTRQNMTKLPLTMEMTPTKIWCCAMMNSQSTQWEQMYAWEVFLEYQTLQENYNTILDESLYFSTFIEYRAFINNTIGFRQTLITDKTPNNNLANYCSKFTRTSLAIGEESLSTLYNYCNQVNLLTLNITNALRKCLTPLYTNDVGKSYFALFTFPKELYILTNDLTMQIIINDKEHIEKEYVANAQQCIFLESALAITGPQQLAWVRKKNLAIEFAFERNQLYNILFEMLGEIGNGTCKFKQIICVKIHNMSNCLSKIHFSGTMNLITMHENFIYNGQELKEQRPSEHNADSVIKSLKVTRNKENLINYILDRGYYIFGTESDVNKLLKQIDADIIKDSRIQPKTLSQYYSNYCIPVINHLKDTITLNEQYKNDVIDKYIELKETGSISDDKLSTNIVTTDIKDANNTFNARDILTNIISRQASNLNKKTYWQIVND